jgi:hypothetical protein
MKILVAAAALLVAVATPAHAQGTVIRPGMSKAEVTAAWGEPYAERTRGSFTYLSFRSDCLPQCGSHDVVILKDGTVVDAIARSSNHRYDGTSSVQRTPGFTDANGVTTPVPPPSGTP